MNNIILGIESSCDDTSAAIIKNGILLSDVIGVQEVHQIYGGVVPELASREHQKNIIPVVERAIKLANVKKEDINAIAFTIGPGLMGSLLVGTSFVKGLALSLNVPLIKVNHLEAHILSVFLKERDFKYQFPKFPFLSMLVSGGHTQIVKVNSFFEMKILGETIDDAAGEAFDKCGKIMGLNYPSGPVIDKLSKKGNPKSFKFSKPKVKDLNFSFSGLKTSFLYSLRDKVKENSNFIKENKNDLCASLQNTIIEILMEKLEKAVKKTGITEVTIAGGVSANFQLRQELLKKGRNENWNVFLPLRKYSTDNAAMIAISGYYKFLDKRDFVSQSVVPNARLKI
ncbi:MAG: tRNA (adenosine(37)-N6)-threonylcarbamoyltransferase complex transferase subunit TsaD [Bacteroidetes bacterium 4572_128]|nr:MAG: tRNA (adenosine(37)-N6)-threonylcarbamoyltransferase complex transferase subunit TsaD [Bacteroidetes bacterium 4572_128]